MKQFFRKFVVGALSCLSILQACQTPNSNIVNIDNKNQSFNLKSVVNPCNIWQVRSFNNDDRQYVYVNGNIIFTNDLSLNQDSGIIDINQYLVQGYNIVTFQTDNECCTNVNTPHSWGYEVYKDGQIVFSDVQYNASVPMGVSHTNSYTINIPLVCPTPTPSPTSTPTSEPKKELNSCDDIPNSKSKADSLNNIQKDITLNIKNLNKILPKPTFSIQSIALESDILKNSIIEKINNLNTTKSELKTLVNSIQLSSDPTETEPVDEPDINEPEPNNGNPPINIELRKQELETLTTEFNNSLGKVSKANSENIIKAIRTLVKEIEFYQTIANEYLAIAETKPKEIIPLISKTSNRINNHLTRINKVTLTQIDDTQREDLANQYQEMYDKLSLYHEFSQALQDDSFQTQSLNNSYKTFSIKRAGTTDDIKELTQSELAREYAKQYNKDHPFTPTTQEEMLLDAGLNTAVDAALLYYGTPTSKAEVAVGLLAALAKLSPEATAWALKSPRVLQALDKSKEAIKSLTDGFKLPPFNGGLQPCFCPSELNTLSKTPQKAKKYFSDVYDKLLTFMKGNSYYPSILKGERVLKSANKLASDLATHNLDGINGASKIINRINTHKDKLEKNLKNLLDTKLSKDELKEANDAVSAALGELKGLEGEVNQAIKLKNEGKNIVEFSRSIPNPNNPTKELIEIDIVTKENIDGIEREVLHQVKAGDEGKKWGKFKNQLDKTKEVAKYTNPPSGISFHSEIKPTDNTILELENYKNKLSGEGVNFTYDWGAISTTK